MYGNPRDGFQERPNTTIAMIADTISRHKFGYTAKDTFGCPFCFVFTALYSLKERNIYVSNKDSTKNRHKNLTHLPFGDKINQGKANVFTYCF